MGGNAAALVPLYVALIGAAAAVLGYLLNRRSDRENRQDAAVDRTAIRQQTEIEYLDKALDKERARTDRLEEEVEVCHKERDADREAFHRRIAAAEQQIDHLRQTLRHILPPERGAPDGA